MKGREWKGREGVEGWSKDRKEEKVGGMKGGTGWRKEKNRSKSEVSRRQKRRNRERMGKR